MRDALRNKAILAILILIFSIPANAMETSIHLDVEAAIKNNDSDSVDRILNTINDGAKTEITGRDLIASVEGCTISNQGIFEGKALILFYCKSRKLTDPCATGNQSLVILPSKDAIFDEVLGQGPVCDRFLPAPPPPAAGIQ